MNTDEFLNGQLACKSGNECPVDASDDFIRGYATQYQSEQILSNQGVK